MVFPATLIISDQPKNTIADIYRQLNHSIKTNDPDTYIIDINSGYGIDQIRQLKRFFSQKSYSSDNKIVVIHQAQNLLVEAQNALLKTLEEPGPNNYILLTTSTPASLLPTILSRCHLIKINSDPKTKPIPLISISGNLLSNLKKSEGLSAAKDDVLSLLEDQLIAYQQQLTTNPSLKTAQTIKKLIKSINMIKAHVDPRSALDYFFLA